MLSNIFKIGTICFKNAHMLTLNKFGKIQPIFIVFGVDLRRNPEETGHRQDIILHISRCLVPILIFKGICRRLIDPNLSIIIKG